MRFRLVGVVTSKAEAQNIVMNDARLLAYQRTGIGWYRIVELC